jgi:hypothetical protein
MMSRRAIVSVAIPAFAFAACTYDGTFTPDAGPGVDGGNEGSADAPLDSVSPPGPGECNLFQDCPPGAYCDFGDDRCGRDGTNGKCVTVPAACDGGDRVCDCRGRAGLTQCEAQRDGVDRDVDTNNCFGDAFPCGTMKCKRFSQLCLMKGGTAECQDLGVCVSADRCTCSAVPKPPCDCQEFGDGGVVVKCP